MHLELDDEDIRELSIALDEHLRILRAELADAETRHFKLRLRRTLDRLEMIAARLKGADMSDSASAGASTD
jgi:hypothetical protein